MVIDMSAKKGEKVLQQKKKRGGADVTNISPDMVYELTTPE